MTDAATLRPILLERIEPFATVLPARRGTLVLGVTTFLVAFLVYLLCVPPTLLSGPAGTSTFRLWEPIVDGYWSLLGGLAVEALGFLAPARAAAIYTAFWSALTAGLVTIWLRQIDVGRRASIAGGLMFAFGSATWFAALSPSPQPFATCLVATLWVFFQQWLATRERRWLLLLGFVLGCGWSEALRSFVAPTLVLAVLIFYRGPLANGRDRLGFALAFLGGCLPNLTVSLWGVFMEGPGRGPHASIHVDPVVPVENLGLLLAWEHAGVGLVLAIAGGIRLFLRHRWEAIAIGVIMSVPCLLAVVAPPSRLSGESLGAFLGVTFMGAALLAAIALDSILQRYGNGPTVRARSVTALGAFVPLFLLLFHFGSHDYSRFDIVERQARFILRSLPADAHLFTSGDLSDDPIFYLQWVQDERPDVMVRDRGGRTGHIRGLPGLLEANFRTIYSTRRLRVPDGYEWQRVGLVLEIRDRSRVVPTPRGDPLEPFRGACFPLTPPADVRDLASRGSPVNAVVRVLAAEFYEALAEVLEGQGSEVPAAVARDFAQRARAVTSVGWWPPRGR